MCSFSVWAPGAKKVSVKIGDESTHAMTAQERGWWRADVKSAAHGTSYAFLLDEDTHPYPDPRSPWQPNGVHAPSRVLDHARFQWHDAAWQPPALSSAVIYELHIGTFTAQGTFASAEEKLSALAELGITHVELMPVNSFPGRWGWGYDGVALFAPQEQYGGPEALKHFVDACHAAGLAVLLDVVYNHFGPVGNYTGKYGPYSTESHRTPWGGAVNLEEAGSDQVRRFFCDNALMWLRDYHFDGLRLDAVHAFVDRSATHFLEQLSTEVDELSRTLNRNFVLIAESDLNDPRIITPRALDKKDAGITGGFGIHAQWSDDFHHALHALLTGERQSYYADFGAVAQLAKAIKSAFVYDGDYSAFRRRHHGRPIHGLNAHCFVVCIQNHDQVGNRALGDRLHQIAGTRKAKLAAAMVLTSPFVPMLFQGEEFAASAPFPYFADHEDPEMRRAVSEGRRREHAADVKGGWESVPDPESQQTFASAVLPWQETTEGEHAEMLDWYRRLIALRKSEHSLHNGDLENVHVRFDEDAGWLAMERCCDGRHAVHVLLNFSAKQIQFVLGRDSEILLASTPGIECDEYRLTLPAESVAILRAKVAH